MTFLSPLITTIINSSLQSGYFPISLKTALINPRLKNPPLILMFYQITGLFLTSHFSPKSLSPKCKITFTHTVSMKNSSLVSAPPIVQRQPWSGSQTICLWPLTRALHPFSCSWTSQPPSTLLTITSTSIVCNTSSAFHTQHFSGFSPT